MSNKFLSAGGVSTTRAFSFYNRFKLLLSADSNCFEPIPCLRDPERSNRGSALIFFYSKSWDFPTGVI